MRSKKGNEGESYDSFFLKVEDNFLENSNP